MSALATAAATRSRARYFILAVIFAVTVLNYGDRAVISIVGTPMSREFGINAVSMGYILSAFSWAYVLAQIPGGWLLDRYGTKWIYALAIFLWSAFTLMQGWIGLLGGGAAITGLFVLRFLTGAAEAPSFPGNSRIVAAWFPSQERGLASAIFNAAQYFAPVVFAPFTGWIASEYGWHSAFIAMGLLGFVMVVIWVRTIHGPEEAHSGANEAERAHLRAGGALMHLGGTGTTRTGQVSPTRYIPQLLGNRMLLGTYVAQFCINVITYFFLTWFPIYLIKQRGMTLLQAGFVASLPALCGFIGGVLGGFLSDRLFQRTGSLNIARKVPIVGGMLLSMCIIGCNYVDSPVIVVALMSLAFFGKGVGALGWAVVSDTAPREIGGLSGALFNLFGNVAGIVTPIVIGYILESTGSFNGALFFVGANAFVAMLAYLVIVGDIHRVELRPLR